MPRRKRETQQQGGEEAEAPSPRTRRPWGAWRGCPRRAAARGAAGAPGLGVCRPRRAGSGGACGHRRGPRRSRQRQREKEAASARRGCGRRPRLGPPHSLAAAASPFLALPPLAPLKSLLLISAARLLPVAPRAPGKGSGAARRRCSLTLLRCCQTPPLRAAPAVSGRRRRSQPKKPPPAPRRRGPWPLPRAASSSAPRRGRPRVREGAQRKPGTTTEQEQQPEQQQQQQQRKGAMAAAAAAAAPATAGASSSAECSSRSRRRPPPGGSRTPSRTPASRPRSSARERR